VRLRGFALALAALVSAGAVVASARAGTRPPTKHERVIVIDLVRAYVESTCCDGIKRIKIDNVLVSTSNPRWAAMNLQGWDKSLAYLGGNTAVLHKAVATERWALAYFGAKAIFCQPPPKVRRDLGLGCPER
jgi:hypothetical protein